MTTATAPRSFPRSVFRFRGIILALGGIVFGLVIGAMFVAALAVQFFDFQIVRVQTGSMTPTYSQGDLVVTRPVKVADINEGDVILFRANTGSQVMHRVIAINRFTTNVQDREGNPVDTVTERQFVTQGDANPAPDANPVHQENVTGEVWFAIPALGGADELTLQTFLLIGAGIIVFMWLSYEGYKFTSRREKKQEESAASEPRPAPPPDDDA